MDKYSMSETVEQVAVALGLRVDAEADRSAVLLLGEDRIAEVRYMGGGEAEIDWGGNGQAMQLRTTGDNLETELRGLLPDLIAEHG